MFVSRACFAASSAAAGIMRPVLRRVEPYMPDWSSFVHLSATSKIDYTIVFKPDVADKYLSEQDKKLRERVSDCAYFLYGDTIVLGGADTIIWGNELLVQELLMKQRFLNRGHEVNMLMELGKWSKKEGLHLVLKDERGAD